MQDDLKALYINVFSRCDDCDDFEQQTRWDLVDPTFALRLESQLARIPWRNRNSKKSDRLTHHTLQSLYI